MIAFYLVINIDVKSMECVIFVFKHEIQSTNVHKEYSDNNLQILHA